MVQSLLDRKEAALGPAHASRQRRDQDQDQDQDQDGDRDGNNDSFDDSASDDGYGGDAVAAAAGAVGGRGQAFTVEDGDAFAAPWEAMETADGGADDDEDDGVRPLPPLRGADGELSANLVGLEGLGLGVDKNGPGGGALDDELRFLDKFLRTRGDRGRLLPSAPVAAGAGGPSDGILAATSSVPAAAAASAADPVTRAREVDAALQQLLGSDPPEK